MKVAPVLSLGLALLLTVLAGHSASAQEAFSSTLDLARHLAAELAAGLAPSDGTIVDVDGRDIYVNLGTQHGVTEGIELRVLRKGREVVDPQTGEFLGTLQAEIGSLRVVHAQERFAVGRLIGSPSQPVEPGMVVRPSGSMPCVAVLELDASGPNTDLARTLPDLLVDGMVRTGALRIIERNEIRRAVTELGFGRSGLVSGDSAKQLGQFLGADYLVVGSVASTGAGKLVSVRALSVTDGSVRASATGLLVDEGVVISGLDPEVQVKNVRLWSQIYGYGNDFGRSELGYWLPITGVVLNTGQRTYAELRFSVEVFDYSGSLLATDRVSLGSIYPGERKSFKIGVYMGQARLGVPSRAEFRLL